MIKLCYSTQGKGASDDQNTRVRDKSSLWMKQTTQNQSLDIDILY